MKSKKTINDEIGEGVIGYLLLVIGYWLLVERQLLVAGYWLFGKPITNTALLITAVEIETADDQKQND